MTPSEMIDAFYAGESLHAVAGEGQCTTVEAEMLLRGFIIGLKSAQPTADEETE